MEGNGNRPVTRADLEVFRGELVQQIGEVVAERLHESETRLLKAFYQYQEHSDVRMRKMSADISNMDTASDLRINNLERRVIEIERKILDSGR